MPTSVPMFTIDDDHSERFSLDAIMADKQGDEDVRDCLEEMKVNESRILGGGAIAQFKVTRVA